MINLTYILGSYIIGGALSYLYAEHNIHKDISHFKQSLLYTLGFIFRPVILGIMELEKLKSKYLICKSIKQINKQLDRIEEAIPLVSEKEKNILLKSKEYWENMLKILNGEFYE